MESNEGTFDPDGPGLQNGQLYGLPVSVHEAAVWVIPVPWDTTVSYRAGTALGPAAILEASGQVEVYDDSRKEAWKPGVYMLEISSELAILNAKARIQAKQIIDAWESGDALPNRAEVLSEVNWACEEMVEWVEKQALEALDAGKIPAVLGGDHSTPLGLIRALAHTHESFGILQIDAHMDLREAYEDFTFSHASIMWNSAQLSAVSRIVQVGVRDYCAGEVELIQASSGRIRPFSFREIAKKQFEGITWTDQVQEMVESLPDKVYISFDIDGLDPALCPDTGTPVPGGLSFEEALYLIGAVVDSGREIIGFDLVEVAPGQTEWNAIVGARLLYRMYVSACNSNINFQEK